jgi:hypothetical protein
MELLLIEVFERFFNPNETGHLETGGLFLYDWTSGMLAETAYLWPSNSLQKLYAE